MSFHLKWICDKTFYSRSIDEITLNDGGLKYIRIGPTDLKFYLFLLIGVLKLSFFEKFEIIRNLLQAVKLHQKRAFQRNK